MGRDHHRPRAIAVAARVHRVRELPIAEVTRVDGLPCTSVARTLVDLAAGEPQRVVERALDQSAVLRLLDGLAVHAAIRHGRPGASALGRIVAAHQAGSTVTRSDLEELFLAFCREVGLPQPEFNAPLVLPSARAIEVDALWQTKRVAVELDSRGFHSHPAAFESDRSRDLELLVAGYLPARITRKQLTEHREWLEAHLRSLLARADVIFGLRAEPRGDASLIRPFRV